MPGVERLADHDHRAAGHHARAERPPLADVECVVHARLGEQRPRRRHLRAPTVHAEGRPYPPRTKPRARRQQQTLNRPRDRLRLHRPRKLLGPAGQPDADDAAGPGAQFDGLRTLLHLDAVAGHPLDAGPDRVGQFLPRNQAGAEPHLAGADRAVVRIPHHVADLARHGLTVRAGHPRHGTAREDPRRERQLLVDEFIPPLDADAVAERHAMLPGRGRRQGRSPRQRTGQDQRPSSVRHLGLSSFNRPAACIGIVVIAAAAARVSSATQPLRRARQHVHATSRPTTRPAAQGVTHPR
ncbi:MAG: hypothetical protein BWZ02_03218 [Lentisphaerae bacterium ADurb.BinA184]|nr:MAG: hypothetical protein BWZ02_03218 [Lentisphaerae bacterium ADurb.BinA184]